MQDLDDDGLGISKLKLEAKLAHHNHTVSHYAADLHRPDRIQLESTKEQIVDEDELKEIEDSIEEEIIQEPDFSELFRQAEGYRAKIAAMSHEILSLAQKAANSNQEANQRVRKQHESLIHQISALKGALQVVFENPQLY